VLSSYNGFPFFVVDPFAQIRQLDEDERWAERNTVITELDHLKNIEISRTIVKQLVEELPIRYQSVRQYQNF